jgi:hypothetical protein
MRFFMFQYRLPRFAAVDCGLLRMFAEQCGSSRISAWTTVEIRKHTLVNRRALRREKRRAL